MREAELLAVGTRTGSVEVLGLVAEVFIQSHALERV